MVHLDEDHGQAPKVPGDPRKITGDIRQKVPRSCRKSDQSILGPSRSERPTDGRFSVLFGLRFGPDFHQLELALVSLPVEFQFGGGEVARRPCTELLLRNPYISYLLGSFPDFNSWHV